MMFVEALLGVIIGFVLGLLPPWLTSKRRAKTHFAALNSEVEMCRSFACHYLTDGVEAPLYRLPLDAYAASLPALLSDAALSKDEVTAITQFYGLVTELNRGLDNADHFHKTENSKLRQSEGKRNRLKAGRLYDSESENEYSAVIKVIKERL